MFLRFGTHTLILGNKSGRNACAKVSVFTCVNYYLELILVVEIPMCHYNL